MNITQTPWKLMDFYCLLSLNNLSERKLLLKQFMNKYLSKTSYKIQTTANTVKYEA